jgi:hypothetical protein
MAPTIYKSVSQVYFYTLDTVVLKNHVTYVLTFLENMTTQITTLGSLVLLQASPRRER